MTTERLLTTGNNTLADGSMQAEDDRPINITAHTIHNETG